MTRLPGIARSLYVLMAVLMAVSNACSGPLVDGRGAANDPESAALRELESETGSAWHVRWHSDVHTPALLEGRTAPEAALSSEKASTAANLASAFFAQHAALFRMSAPAQELVVESSEVDELGMAHVRFGQQRGGVPVWRHGLGAHFDKDGALVRVEGRYAPLVEGGISPSITSGDATDSALRTVAAARAIVDSTMLNAGDPELVLDAIPMGQGSTGLAVKSGANGDSGTSTGDPVALTMPARLAWRLELEVAHPAHPALVEVFVDAETAEAYRVSDILDDMKGSGVGVFGEPQTIEVAVRKARYFLEDSVEGTPAQKIYTAKQEGTLPGSEVSSASADRWDQGLAGSGSAVDAAAYVTATNDYFTRVHGRRGALDKGAGMHATVHYGQAYANAFWNGKQLVFGDGDGKTMAPLAGALDVVAHEYAHAVSQTAAQLGHEGEAGALNEAVSDVFACFVEHAERNGSGNWQVGEDVLLSDAGKRYGMRDLADPHQTRNPAHVDEERDDTQDRGGVHLNSTIVAHAAFLMTEGGTNVVSRIRVEGIGREAAERIWYRALTRYLTAMSVFRDAAEATMAAARDLHGEQSAEVLSVTAAWQAVGILDP